MTQPEPEFVRRLNRAARRAASNPVAYWGKWEVNFPRFEVIRSPLLNDVTTKRSPRARQRKEPMSDPSYRSKRARRFSESATHYVPYEPKVRCLSCGAPAAMGWCAGPVCVAERERYQRELAAFAAKYPETTDRLAAISRKEAPAWRHA